jgi:hypothetical protein
MPRVYHGSPGRRPPGVRCRTELPVPLLAAATVVLLLASRARPGWRRPAAIACWVLLPTAIGWFVLAGRLI